MLHGMFEKKNRYYTVLTVNTQTTLVFYPEITQDFVISFYSRGIVHVYSIFVLYIYLLTFLTGERVLDVLQREYSYDNSPS